MAGDWIKFELATIDKPEVLQMADMLEVTSDEVVGKLLRVWGWFDQRSKNGDAGGVTNVTLEKFIDRHVGMQGFAASMKKVGWLTDVGLPNFVRHNGESAKNRALTKDRMKRLRDANVTQKASPEKRREEKKLTTGEAKASLCVSGEEASTALTPTNQTASRNMNGGARGVAERVLEFLNERAKRDFRPTDVNLDFILARLKEGYTEGQCRQVIAKKIREWGEDDMMAKFIRPATLFNREKFNQYAGELVAMPDGGGAA